MSQILQPQLSHQFAGIVWRMELDASGKWLALEVRNEADKQVSFAAVNLETNEVPLQNYTVDERWMAGLEGIHNGIMLLHYYQSAGSPAHKGMVAVDAATGRQLWASYNLAFHYFSINGLVGYDARLQPRTLQVLDILNGSIVRPYNQVVDVEVFASFLVPEMVTDEGRFPEPAFGNIAHQLLYKQYIIVSLHAQAAAGGLAQKLFIVADGNTIFTDLLNTGIQKMQPEAFVLQNNQLIYLKDRSQLRIINL